MKKLFLFVFLMATAAISMAQSTRANHFKKLFSHVPGHTSNVTLRAALTSPKLQLDSMVYAGMSKGVISYNENGICTTQTTYTWDDLTNQWKPYYLNELFYDENGKLELIILSSWDSNTSSWIQLEKNQRTYAQNGKDYISDSYYWSNNNWKADESYKYEFFSDGNDSIALVHYKASLSSDWELKYKLVYLHDESGNSTTCIDYNWYNNKWNYDSKVEYTYDNNYSYEDLIIPPLQVSMKHMITKESQYSYNSTDSSWDFDREAIYYYSPKKVALGVNPNTTNKLKATVLDGQLLISGIATDNTLVIYNMQGVALYNQKVSNNTVSIAAPGNGIYIVRNGEQSAKVIQR